ncbi:MAG: pyrimidine 5'-nucleotidase [Francisellaceae bacterium]
MPLNYQHYIFDLDNTLYPASNSFFERQLENMSRFIVKKLKISKSEADFLREDYYHTYGTTMHGLMKNHAIDPAEFLAYIDELPLDDLRVDTVLIDRLEAIKCQGRHISVFTNGSRFHAYRVMDRLELNRVFDDVVTLECTGLIPKPDIRAYHYCCSHLHIDPENAVFFEDSSHNLITAKTLGMATVLIKTDETSHARFIAHPEIDYFTKDILSFFDADFLDFRGGRLNE